MHTPYQFENKLMETAIAELRLEHKLASHTEETLRETFGERFSNGWELAASRKVRRYDFKPSGRVIWAVQGRKSEYQVMPDIPFCYCDDYYFRVMDKKRGLCYHIIAQKLAEALEAFESVSATDSQYQIITDRWRARERQE
jgi:predicted nucleic acid-binding Zn finger protein